MANKIYPTDIPALNLVQMIQNPTGSNTAYMARRSDIKENMQSRYKKIIRTHGRFKYEIYYDKNDYSYYFYFKIPSEKYDKLYYDTVIQFYPKSVDAALKKDKIDKYYQINMFSNSPQFMFTYTYVLYNNDYTVKFLNSKLSEKAKNEKPTIRNPVESYGFEKTCYWACFFIQENRMYEKKFLERHSKTFNTLEKKRLKDKISTCYQKLTEYNEFKIKASLEKKKKQQLKNRMRDLVTFKKTVADEKNNRIKSTKKSKNNVNMKRNMKVKPRNMSHNMKVTKKKK